MSDPAPDSRELLGHAVFIAGPSESGSIIHLALSARAASGDGFTPEPTSPTGSSNIYDRVFEQIFDSIIAEVVLKADRVERRVA